MATISLTLPTSGTVVAAGLHIANYGTLQSVINGGLDNNNFAAGKIFDNTKIMQGGALTGQGLIWNGTSWVPGAVGTPPTHLGLPAAGASVCASGANKIWLVPIPGITATTPFSRLTMMDNGAGGTIDVGVYFTDDEATFTKLVTTGAAYTLVGGAVVKVFSLSGTITPVVGRRWFVAACFSSTGAVQAAGFVQGAYFLTGGSAVLPASITGVTVGGAAQAPAYMLAV